MHTVFVILYASPVTCVVKFAHTLSVLTKKQTKTHWITVMKLRLPHKFQAALMAALASVSFTTLSTASLGAAFFLGHQTFAEDAADESTDDTGATINIGYADLNEGEVAGEDAEGIIGEQTAKTPIEVGSNGSAGNNAGLLATESVDIDETVLDTVAGSGQQDTVSGSVDATPAENLGFTANPYATGTESSNGSVEVFQIPANTVAQLVQEKTPTQKTTSTGTNSTPNGTSGLSIGSGLGSIGASSFGAISTPLATGLSVDTSSVSNDIAPITTLGAGSAQTLHIYILTGQSNSQGAVYNNPASPEQLATYDSDAIMWNGNFISYTANPPTVVSTTQWTDVQPQEPTYTNLCMGPEYGFSYMMEKFADNGIISSVDQLGILKASLNGGGNKYWVKGSATYNTILNTAETALTKAIADGYTNITIDGLLYLQGESDGSDASYAGERYLAFKTNLSNDLKAWLATQGQDAQNAITINFEDNTVLGQPSQASGDTNTQQQSIAGTNTDKNGIGYLYTSDLGGSMRASASTIHFGGSAQLVIGARYAYSFAVQNGANVGAVRSSNKDQYLDNAMAWWMEKLPETTDVVKWDLSSVSISGGNRIQNSLTVGGIKVEDPYNTNSVDASTVYITGGSLSVGASGIELEKGGLSIASAFNTTAAQTWKIAAGKTLEIGSASASVAFGGSHTISIGEQSVGAGAGSVKIYASSDAGHDFVLQDGAKLAVNASSTVWNQADISVTDSGIFGTITNGVLNINTLSLGSGAEFDFGGNVGVQLSVGTLALSGDATFRMNVNSASVRDMLTIGNVSAGSSPYTITFDLTEGDGVRGGTDYVLVDGWNSSLMQAVVSSGAAGSPTLKVVGNQLFVTFASGASEDYTKPWVAPTGSPMVVDAGTFDATAKGGFTSGTASTLSVGKNVSGDVYFYASDSNYTGDVYAELQDASVKWVAAYGSGSSSNMKTLTGSASVKVGQSSDTTAQMVTAVYGALNANVSGDVYVELDATNYTYGSVNGAHHAKVDGNLTTVIKGGTVTGQTAGGFVNTDAFNVASGDVRLQIDGGTFNGNVIGGSNGANSVIEGDIHMNINGGTFKNYVLGGGFAGTYNGDVYVTISGGDFSASKGVYAGFGSSSSSVSAGTHNTTVTLFGIDDENQFAQYTGVLSGGNQAGTINWTTRTLDLKSYTASELKANLTSFTQVNVLKETSTVIKKSSQASDLGGASALQVDGTSTLELNADNADWSLANVSVTVNEEGTLRKTGSNNLTLGNVSGAGTLALAEGNATVGTFVNATANVASGSTLTVNVASGKIGTLSGAGSVLLSGTINGNTNFACSEGQWTGSVTITGSNITTDKQELHFNNFGTKGSTVVIDGIGHGVSTSLYLPNGEDNAINPNIHLTGNGLTLTDGASSGTAYFNGDWSGDGSFSFTKASVTQSFMFLGDFHAYSGNISLSGAQKLYFGNGDIATASFVPGGGSATGTGTISGPSSGSNFTTVAVNYMNDVTLASTFQGALNLVVNTNQEAALTKANTYTGTTMVQSGSLAVRGDGTLGKGQVTIKNDSTKAILNLALGENATITAKGQDATITGHSVVNANSIQGASASSLATVSHAVIAVAEGKTLELANVNLVDTAITGSVDLTTGVSADNLTILTASTFKLAGEDMLHVSGALALESGATLDLARLFETPVQSSPLRVSSSGSPQLPSSLAGSSSALSVDSNLDGGNLSLLGAVTPTDGTTYVLASAQSIDLASGVNLTNLAEGYTGALSTQAVDGGGYNLILTLAAASNDLIWDNHVGDNMWDISSTANWHASGTDTPGTSTFAQNDNVTFVSGVTNSPVLQSDITAGTVTIESGATATINGNGYTLTTDSIDAARASLALNGGTVSVAQNSTVGSLSGSAALQIAENATLTVGDANNSTYTGAISGAGAIEKSGTGTLTLSGNNTFSGGLTVNEGTVSVTSKGNLGAGSVTVGQNGTVLFTSNDLATVDSLSVEGPGKLRLVTSTRSEVGNALNTISASNLYLEDNSNHSGRYYYDGSTDLTGVRHLYLDGGQLWVNASMEYNGDVTFNATTYSESGTLTGAAIRVHNAAKFAGNVNVAEATQFAWCSNSVVEFAGPVSGSGNLNLKRFNSDGTFKVSGNASNYQGAMTSDSQITLNVTKGGQLSLAGGSNLEGSVTIDGTLTMNGATGSTSTISGAVSGFGTLATAATNGSTVNVTGSMDSFAGAISAQGGTLNLAPAASSITTHDVHVASGATLNITAAASNTSITAHGTMYNNGSLTLTGVVNLNPDNISAFEQLATGPEPKFDGKETYEGSGYLRTSAWYYLVKGGADSTLNKTGITDITGGALVTDAGTGVDIVVTLDTSTGRTGVYYVNSALTYNSTEMVGATALSIAPNASLTTTTDVANLLKKSTGTGTFVVGDDNTITGISPAAPFASSFAGTLEVAANKKLTLGTNTNGQYIDFSTLEALVLGAGANIDTTATKVTINNLTANGSTINIKDSPSAGSGEPAGVSLELQGTTTLAGNLTITSGWKYRVNIEALSGAHDLELKGGNEKHYAEIGDADIHALKVGDNMTNVKLTGTVKLSDNLEAKRGTIEVSGSTSVGQDLDLSVSGAANGTVLVKNGGSLTTKGMWGRPDAHLYIENGGQLALTDPGLQIAGTGATNAEVSTTSNSSFATNSGNWTISNAAVSTTKGMTLANKLTNSSLTTADNVTLSNAENTLTSTTVTANTLTVTGANMALGNVIVSGGTLNLTTTVRTGSLSVADGATLKLAGAENLAIGDTLTLASGSILDLANITGATGTESITLATTSNGISGDLTGVTLTNWTDPTGYTSTLETRGNNLVLTFTPVSNDLIWDAHTNNIWTNNGAGNWHIGSAEEGSSVFAANDSVIFKDGTHTVSLEDNVTAGTMTVAAGENLTITDNSHNISATSVSIGGTLNANSGVLNASTPVTIAENGKWVVSDTIPTTDAAKAMNVTVQDGGELHIKGGNGNGSRIVLPDASGAGKVVLDSGTISYLSDLGGNTLVLNSGTSLRFGHALSTAIHEYAGNIELAGNANLSVWGSSQHPGGVTVSGNISGGGYTLTRDDGDRLVAFTGNVTLGGFNNNASAAKFSGSNTVIGNLNSNQQTEFTGAATVDTLSSSGNVIKSGAGTTLTLGGTNNYTGAVTVNSGALALTDSMTLGAVTVTNAGTLRLAGNDEMLTTTGAFTLTSGSTLDLSAYTFSGTETVTLVTTTGSGSIVDPGDWSSVNLVFNGDAPENAALRVMNNNLVLTFAPPADLIWDNTSSDSSWTSSPNWHVAEAELGSSVFKNGDNVSFTSATPNAAPALGADVTAGTMSIATGETVTVGGSHALTVTQLAGEGANLVMDGSSLTVLDGGTSTIGTVTEHGGTMNVANTGTAKGAALFTGDIQVDGGSTLNLTPAGHDTTIADTEGAKINGKVIIGTGEGTAEIKVTNQSSVTLTEGLHFAENAAEAKFTITGDRNQYVNGLHGSDVTLNIERTNTSGETSRAGYFVVSNLSKDEFSGTINLHTIPGASGRQNGGMIVYNSPEGLANTVVNFGTRDSDSALAFLEDRSKGTWDGDYQDGWSRSLKGGTFQNALLGGLDGTKGKVWANDLTINTAADVSTTFGGVLAINSLTKDGDGTQTLTAANTYTGGTVVSGGSLVAANATALGTGDVTVAAGATLEFAPSLTSAAQTGAITLASASETLPGGTLTFGGVGDNALNVTGALTLGSGSVLDVSNLNFTDETGKVILAKTTGGITPTDLSSVKIEGQSGYGYTLSLDGNNLVLDYESSIKTLIWRGASSNVWMNESREEGTNKNWYTANNPGTNIPFSDYDRVRFATNATVQLGSDIVSGRMIVDSNRSVTIDTKGHALSVDYIEGSGGSLTVKGTDDQTQATRIQGSTTLKNLTLDDGTVSLGGHTEVSEKLTVKNDAEVTVSGTMATKALDISGGSSVSLAAGGTALTTKVEGDSTLTVGANSSLSQLTLNSGTVTNNATLTLSNTQDTMVSGDSRITGTGTTITTGIRLADNSTLTIDGGQTVSITTDHGIIGGSGNGSVLTLDNVTMTGTASWTVADSVDTVNLTSTTGSGTVFDTNAHSVTVDAGMSGTGNLTKAGHGTLTLNGSNSFSGDTTISGGTLKVNKADGLTSSANVSVADGATLWFNSPTTANISGNTVIANGGMLHLGSENALATTGTLTFNDTSVLNLSGLEIKQDQTEYVLASGQSINLSSGFDMNDVIVEYGTHPATGHKPSISVRTNETKGVQELVLAYDVINSNTLYWNGGTANWTDANVWHDKQSESPTTFTEYDDVFFDPAEYSDPAAASVQANVTQNTNVHDMNIVAREGEGATKNTVNVEVNSGNTLTVDFLNADDNTEFIKKGAGTASVGIKDPHFGADISVTDGTLTTQFLDMAGNGMVVDGNITRTGGTLNIEVGRVETPTNVKFTQSVSGVKDFIVNEGSNATFSGQVTVPNEQDIYMDVANDASVTFKENVSLAANNWIMQGDGTVNFDGHVDISEVTGNFNQLNGNVNVNFNGVLNTVASQINIRLDPGTNLYINELDLLNSGQDTLYFTFKNTYGTQVDRDSVQIDKLVIDGSRGLGTNTSSLPGLKDYQAGGDINIKQLVNAAGSTSDDIARLCNYAGNLNGATQGGWGIAQVFNLGGATEEGSAFEGIIRLQDSRNQDSWAGTADNHKKTVVVLNDEYVASEAVIELKNYSNYSDFGIGINTANAKVTAIEDYNGHAIQSGNYAKVFSGAMDTANTAVPQSDDTLRTLELIGEKDDTADTVHSTSAGVDKNLNIVKEGVGTQVFSGDSSKFNGSIDARDGLLKFLNTASLTVQDLTLAANGTATDGTLAVRSDAAGSNVGMASVHGTLKANSGAVLDSNLTMAADSVLDVRSTLTTQQGEYADKTDYVGGLNMLGNSLTLQSGAYLSDADRSALLSMQWGERYELAYNLSSLTLGSTTYTDPIEFVREDYEHSNIEASQYFANLQESDYYICYSGSNNPGAGGNVGTLYIFKAPEPATSTLSLLALAALAARRRRK